MMRCNRGLWKAERSSYPISTCSDLTPVRYALSVLAFGRLLPKCASQLANDSEVAGMGGLMPRIAQKKLYDLTDVE